MIVPVAHLQGVKHSAGFTLIEVLVAITVLSIGLLGAAALQFTALQNSNRSNEKSLATFFAYDIVDRMRVNTSASREGFYQVDPDETPDEPPVGNGAGRFSWCRTDFNATASPGICSDDEMATADLHEWFTLLSEQLPSGRARVQCIDAIDSDASPCSAGSVHSITLMWDELRTGATGTGCDPDAPDTDLFCLSVDVQI